MATTPTPGLTAEEFFAWANRPGNEGRTFELDAGEVVEVSSSGEAHALVCWFVIRVLTEFIMRRGSGHLLTNDCGLIVGRSPDTVRGPDVMLFLENRTLDQAVLGHTDRIPNLVVEVLSPSDTPKRVNRRVAQYLGRGVPLIWSIDIPQFTVTTCRPNEFPEVLDRADELTGNGVLPDFRCPVRDLFSVPGSQSSRGTPES